MADVKCMEHHTLKVPYEILNKRFRTTQKVLEREVSHVTSTIGELEKALKDSQPAAVVDLLKSVEEGLVELAGKAEESMVEEAQAVECAKKRVEHLKMGASSRPGADWKKTRLDRLLVEHFLRSGYYESAITLAKSSGIEDLTNIGLFLVAKDVEEALNGKDTSKCLEWCQDNRSKLRKMKSTLEFNLRLQEFVEQVKRGQQMKAVAHARKHLAAIDDSDQLGRVQQACALLVFPHDTLVQPYKDMYDGARWQQLVEQFRAENFRLYQLSNQSVFAVAMQAGLSALKTSLCYRPVADRNYECPVCQTPLNELAAPLPFAHCSQSRLICSMSGKPMNEHNHPLMLPNGYVYGERALRKMAEENGGNVICPRTKEVFSIGSASKVYIM